MAVTQTYTLSIRGSLGTLTPAPTVISGDLEESVSVVVDANDSLVEAIVIDKDNVDAMYLWCDQDVAVTTNVAADDTFNLAADVPYYWHKNLPGTCPLTVDVTEIHVDNSANGVVANFKAEFLLTVAV